MRNERGQVLWIVLGILLMLFISTPPLIKWLQSDSERTVKQQKSSTAFNLANGALERGMWKLKSSTSTWAAAAIGTTISGYNFDVTYKDLEGGTYRIRFSSGPGASQVTVTAEARDPLNEEIQAVQAVYQNQSIPGPILTTGNVAFSGVFEPHWGPVMAQGNITITGNAAPKYYPRKYSKNAVTGTATYPRDTNGITPPNTNNVEWWSAYSVPDLPLLDFATLRSSAQANGTLNYYNVNASSTGHTLTGYSGGHYNNCRDPDGSAFASHASHFYDPQHHPLATRNLIWYWDNDLIITGGPWQGSYSGTAAHRMGLRGTLIVRGNLTIWTGDDYTYTGTIPTSAWREYQAIDTASANQYPGDTGLRSNASTFPFGSQSWTGGPSTANTDIGIRGFIYVGGNFTIQSEAGGDFHGALWVVGNATNMNTNEYSLVFYDSGLDVPVLNVILTLQSWRETSPSSTVWAP